MESAPSRTIATSDAWASATRFDNRLVCSTQRNEAEKRRRLTTGDAHVRNREHAGAIGFVDGKMGLCE